MRPMRGALWRASKVNHRPSRKTSNHMKDAVKLLDQTLAEEKKTDDTLTKLADSEVNAVAQAA
jgi:hypothetical protein